MKKEETTVAANSAMSLIVSDDKKPNIAVKPGMKLQVVAVSLVDSQMKKARPSAARLCGGTSTCVALIDLSK